MDLMQIVLAAETATNDELMGKGMLMAYLKQGEVYFSESRTELVPIASMHPVHARNAAEKLLREAGYWARFGTLAYGEAVRPLSTIAASTLYQALVRRGA